MGPDITLPLRFVLTGVVCLLAAVGLLAVYPELLATYHYSPHAVAVTHLVALGFMASVVMGASYQLLPVALETPLYSERLGRWQFVLHVVGFVGMVWMFWYWNLEQVGHYASVLVFGVLLLIYNVVRTLLRARRLGAVGVGVASALFWLLVAVSVGLALAAGKCTYESVNRLSVWSPVGMLVHGLAALAEIVQRYEPIPLMHAHAHLGGMGFFLMMIVAVSFQLAPMFTLSELPSERRALQIIWLLNGGLAFLFVALALNSRWKLLALAPVVAALAAYGRELRLILRARHRRKLDWGMRSYVVAMSLIGALIAMGTLLCWPLLPATPLLSQLENVYGFLGLFGVITLSILGFLHKIVPFLVWYRVYSPRVGKYRIPAMGDLYSERLLMIGFWVYVTALALVSVGAAARSTASVRWGAVTLLAALAVFGWNLVVMLRHLWRPQLTPLTPPTAAQGQVGNGKKQP
jgi:hypothetical protein